MFLYSDWSEGVVSFSVAPLLSRLHIVSMVTSYHYGRRSKSYIEKKPAKDKKKGSSFSALSKETATMEYLPLTTFKSKKKKKSGIILS